MNQRRRIGILTGGGDCAGLNPAIKALATKALDSDCLVLGIKNGYQGLVDEKLEPMALDHDSVCHIERQGGTILGTSRTNPYKMADGPKIVQDRLKDLGLDALIAIGGEDTLGVAAKLYRDFSINVVGIPKTIDGDLLGTDYCLGFASALEIITKSVDNLRSTADAHARVLVVEVMGRHAGHLALQGGISSAALVVLLPEHPFSISKVAKLVEKQKNHGARYSIVMVAEGAIPEGADMSLVSNEKDAFGHVRLGGIAHLLATEIEKHTKIESRAMVLGHLQRGGSPSAYDRRMGFYFGIAAFEAVMNKNFGQMVALKDGRIGLSPLSEVLRGLKTVDVQKYYDTETYQGKQSVFF